MTKRLVPMLVTALMTVLSLPPDLLSAPPSHSFGDERFTSCVVDNDLLRLVRFELALGAIKLFTITLL